MQVTECAEIFFLECRRDCIYNHWNLSPRWLHFENIVLCQVYLTPPLTEVYYLLRWLHISTSLVYIFATHPHISFHNKTFSVLQVRCLTSVHSCKQQIAQKHIADGGSLALNQR